MRSSLGVPSEAEVDLDAVEAEEAKAEEAKEGVEEEAEENAHDEL